MTSSGKKAIYGGGVLAALAAAVLFWRNPAGIPAGSGFATASIRTEAAEEVESRRHAHLVSAAATAASTPVAFEKSGLPLAPSGDYDIAISDSELQAIVEARYGPLVHSLALTPAAGARLFELLTERQHAAIDVANAAMVAGLNPIRDLATIQKAIALAEADVDADIAREHGAAVAAACRDFESTRAERNTVDQLAHTLADAGEPLTASQRARLVSALRDTTTQAPADINSAIFGRFNRRVPINAQAIASAAPELSGRQLDALRQLVQATPPARVAGD